MRLKRRKWYRPAPARLTGLHITSPELSEEELRSSLERALAEARRLLARDDPPPAFADERGARFPDPPA